MNPTPHIDTAESGALTATQWARRFKIAPSTVSRWALDGRVEYVQVGREIRITADAMETCLRERTEARQRRHRERTAGETARGVVDAAEVDQELAQI
jgi:hypothetical protein